MNTTFAHAAVEAAVTAHADALAGNVAMPSIEVPAGATITLEGAEVDNVDYVSAYHIIKELIAEQKE
jgi:hypothetical protein